MADAIFELSGKRVYVAGHRGLVGSALVRRLASENCRILTADRAQLDLRVQAAVDRWFDEHRPEAVFLAAARVGGIYANDICPADFLHDNLAIQTNVVEAARRFAVGKLMFFGSSCIYPRLAPQPIAESALLTGPLEPTNQWYAIAKIAGLKLCEAYRRQHSCDFVSVMPTNLYGPGDNFDPLTSHVLAALIAKISAAAAENRNSVELWGTGRPRREFLHVDDLADAAVFLMRTWSEDGHVNIGAGADLTIAELAQTIARIVGFGGQFSFDASKPDGTPQKLLDISRLERLGWHCRIDIETGIRQTYEWYLKAKPQQQRRAKAAAPGP
ncbi:MAG: GDP-L-fucose synthase [Stellaceae bacterium]